MAMEWKDEYSVGNDHIDAQHRELFRRFNALIEACRESRGREKVGELLSYLDEYVENHFADEEALMIVRGYPGLEKQRREHEEFRGELKKLKGILAAEGASVHLTVTTNEAVLQWLIRHIRKTDAALAAFLRDRG